MAPGTERLTFMGPSGVSAPWLSPSIDSSKLCVQQAAAVLHANHTCEGLP